MTPQMKNRSKQAALNMPKGRVEVANGLVTLQPENGATIAPIPVKNAQVIVNAPLLEKELSHEPGFLAGGTERRLQARRW